MGYLIEDNSKSPQNTDIASSEFSVSFTLIPTFAPSPPFTERYAFCSLLVSVIPLARICFTSHQTNFTDPSERRSQFNGSKPRYDFARFLLYPLSFHLSFYPLCSNSGPCGLIMQNQTRSTDINKNNLIFHIRLLREKTGLSTPKGGKRTPLSDVPEQADQTTLLSAFFLSLYFGCLLSWWGAVA